MVLESEGEGDDWRDISANNFELISNGDILQADNFVIVNYKGRHYPGGKKKYIAKLCNNFRPYIGSKRRSIWSYCRDTKRSSREVATYRKQCMLEKIDIPKGRSKRGIFAVLEMEKYSFELTANEDILKIDNLLIVNYERKHYSSKNKKL